MKRAPFSLAVLSALFALGCGWEPNTEIDPPRHSGRSQTDLETSSSRGSQSTSTDDFYETRRRFWDDRQLKRDSARTSLSEKDLTWVSTAQDARVALLVSPDTGFDTWGIETSVAEIPTDWHTGRHRHGEVAIYIVSGEGFISVDGIRYDIYPGTTIGVPYGEDHQLFNLGPGALRYFTASAYPLERHLGLYRLEQIENCGQNTTIPQLPVSANGYDKGNRRIRLLWEEAHYRDGSIGLRPWLEARLRGGVNLRHRHSGGAPGATNEAAKLASAIGHHSAWIRLMGSPGQMDFANRMALISGFLIEDPGAHSGRHSHMEAVIYVLSGQGHSVVDGTKIRWSSGSSLHIQGPQTEHQHFNTGEEPAFMLRVANGLRPHIRKTVEQIFPFLWFEAHGRDTAGSSHEVKQTPGQ